MATLHEIMARKLAERQAQDTWEATVDDAALAMLTNGIERVPADQLRRTLDLLAAVQDGRRSEWPLYQGKRISRATLDAGYNRVALAIEALEA